MKTKSELKEALILEATILIALLSILKDTHEVEKKMLQNQYLNMLKKALKQAEDAEDFETCIDLKKKIDAVQSKRRTTEN
jgi:protein-arginine kinase activator protein McsA